MYTDSIAKKLKLYEETIRGTLASARELIVLLDRIIKREKIETDSGDTSHVMV
jgi:hypothetical protein